MREKADKQMNQNKMGQKSESKREKTAQKKGITLTYGEPERKNQIWKIDLEMRELRKRWHKKMKTKNVPYV